MIQLDGKQGGGQILRTALGLSILTQKPFTLTNIRANRPKPGLKEQHIQCIQAAKKLCDGEVEGNYFNSQQITFKPSKISQSNLKVKIATAGSQALVLQTLLIASMKGNLNIEIIGGATDTFFSPPLSHYQHIFYPLLKQMGYEVKTKVTKYGFYPKGGAESETQIKAAKLKSLILEKGEVESITIKSIAEKSLGKAKVAGRLAKEAKKILEKEFETPIKVTTSYVDASNPGCRVQIILKTDKSIFGADALGEKGKPAETISENVAKQLIEDYKQGSVDSHTGDMLLPFIAIAGGKYKVPKVTNHIKTSIYTIEKFLDVNFSIEDNVIEAKTI